MENTPVTPRNPDLVHFVLSSADALELQKFQQALTIIRNVRQRGKSHMAAIHQAYLEVYGDDENHTLVLGEEGVRDTDNPCPDFVYGDPHPSNRCEGDGHYLCAECGMKKAPEVE